MFDPTKPVQTRDGRSARIIVSDAENPNFPIVAMVENISGSQWAEQFTPEGRLYQGAKPPHPSDLVNVVERTEEFRTVGSPDTVGTATFSLRFGNIANSTEEDARSLLGGDLPDWDGVARIVREDGRIVELEFLGA